MELTRKEIHAAVRNYIANDLGLDRTEIERILREQIEARNPAELVRQSVNQYFHVGQNGFTADRHVRTEIDRTVREAVADALKKDTTGHMALLIQESMEDLYRAKQSGAGTLPTTVIRPGMAVYQNVCEITSGIAIGAVMSVVDEVCPPGHGMNVTIRKSEQDGKPYAEIGNITIQYQNDIIAALQDNDPQDARMLHVWGNKTIVRTSAFMAMLSSKVTGWPISDVIWHDDKLLLLGERHAWCEKGKEE